MPEYFFLVKKNSQILATCGEYFSWQTCQSSVKSFQQQQQKFYKLFPPHQPQQQQQLQLLQHHGLYLLVSITEQSRAERSCNIRASFSTVKSLVK